LLLDILTLINLRLFLAAIFFLGATTAQQRAETGKAFKRRLYDVMADLLRETPALQAMRVRRLWPPTEWSAVWPNLHAPPVPDDIKMEWCRVIHDIVPTQNRLHRIDMAVTNLCGHRGTTDNIKHRIIECGEGHMM
jgi:hypothetical protein